MALGTSAAAAAAAPAAAPAPAQPPVPWIGFNITSRAPARTRGSAPVDAKLQSTVDTYFTRGVGLAARLGQHRLAEPRQPGRALDGEPKVLLQKRHAIRARNPERLVAQVGERRGAAAQLAWPTRVVSTSASLHALSFAACSAENAAAERLHLRGEAPPRLVSALAYSGSGVTTTASSPATLRSPSVSDEG